MGVIQAVCISEKKGTQKSPVDEIELVEDFGVKGDAHAGNWHRQVSLLSAESAEAFKNAGAPIHDGSFGENMVVRGFDFKRMPVGTRYRIGSGDDAIVLEQTQTGKHCHSRCEIYHIMGDCIMPREGVFVRVIKGGVVRPGEEMVIDYVPSAEAEAQIYASYEEKWPEAIAAEERARARDAQAAQRRQQRMAQRVADHVNEVLGAVDANGNAIDAAPEQTPLANGE